MKQYNLPQQAARVYKKAGCHQEVVQALIDMGQNDKATMYMRQNNINTDYVSLIRNTLTSTSPNAA